jgi:hypothetical protein
MHEPSNQNEMCSNTLERSFEIVIDEKEHICQSEITTQSVEECRTNTLTTETLSVAELNTENITVINDESDDEPLLSIPPLPNNRKICSHYWLEIFIGSKILIFIAMIIAAGILILFTKDSKASSLWTKGCDKQSETGRFFYDEVNYFKSFKICFSRTYIHNRRPLRSNH